jgi:hypothetical protein
VGLAALLAWTLTIRLRFLNALRLTPDDALEQLVQYAMARRRVWLASIASSPGILVFNYGFISAIGRRPWVTEAEWETRRIAAMALTVALLAAVVVWGVLRRRTLAREAQNLRAMQRGEDDPAV